MSVPPKYKLNELTDEVKTYIVIDVHNRAREWTCNLREEFQNIPPDAPAFIVTDGGGVVQLLYVVSVDDLENFMEDEEEGDEEK